MPLDGYVLDPPLKSGAHSTREAAGEPTAEFKREQPPLPPIGESADAQAVSILSLVSGDVRRRRAEQERRDDQLLAAFAVARVLARQKLPTETFMEFAAALRKAGEAYAIPEPYYVVAFINGMGYEETARLLRATKPVDLTAAAKEAIWVQRSDGASQPPSLPLERGKRRRTDTRNAPSAGYTTQLPPRKRTRRDSGSCYTCHKFGHYARACPKRWGSP